MAGSKKLHDQYNRVFGDKSNSENLTVPCSFYVVFLSGFFCFVLFFWGFFVLFCFVVVLMIMLLLHLIFYFAAQSPSYFLPNSHHLGVCKEPVPKYRTDQRRLAQLRELRAKFFLS